MSTGIYYDWPTAMRVARRGTYVRRKAWTNKWLQRFGGLWWMREGTADPTVVEADEFTASEFRASDWTHYPLDASGNLDLDGAEPIDPGNDFPITIEDPLGISDPGVGGGSGGSSQEIDPNSPLLPFEGGGGLDTGAGGPDFIPPTTPPTPPTPPSTPDEGDTNDPIIPPGTGDPPPPGFVGDPGFSGEGGTGSGQTGGSGEGGSGGSLPPIGGGGGGGGGGVTPKPPRPPRAGINWPTLSFGPIDDLTHSGNPPWCYANDGVGSLAGATFGGRITLSTCDDEAYGLYVVSIRNAGQLIWSATMSPGDSLDWTASFTGVPGSSSFALSARAWGVTNQPDITASATTPTMAPWCDDSSNAPVGEP